MPDRQIRIDPDATPRRGFLSGLGKITISGAAIALLAGQDRLAIGSPAHAANPTNDVTVLNAALGAEQEAVAAYGLATGSGLLDKPVRDLAQRFKGHHEEHRDALARTVAKLGGTPVVAAKSYSFPVEKLKSQTDVLSFAAELEKGAVSAYLGAVPILDDRELARVAASILGDEAMHWAVLRYALGQDPVPVPFVS